MPVAGLCGASEPLRARAWCAMVPYARTMTPRQRRGQAQAGQGCPLLPARGAPPRIASSQDKHVSSTGEKPPSRRDASSPDGAGQDVRPPCRVGTAKAEGAGWVDTTDRDRTSARSMPSWREEDPHGLR